MVHAIPYGDENLAPKGAATLSFEEDIAASMRLA